MKQKILFVDGETLELKDLMNKLAARPHPWELLYARNGLEALGVLDKTSCDAVVADLRLPDMSGDQLLGQVMKQFPQVHRVALADLADLQSLLRCVGNVYQFLTKPCDAERLQVVLNRAFALDFWLPNPTARKLIGSMPQLPSPASLYAPVVRELQSAAASPESVGALIAQDPAMTTRVLQLANSTASGPPTDEADPVHAVKALGIATTKAMLLLSHTYANFSALGGSGFSVESLWRHSQETGRLAAWIAQYEHADGATIQQAATAGLLHDLGKLALAANLPDQFRQVPKLVGADNLPWWRAEQQVFGATHGEVGGWLLGIWGLPMPVVEAVALHHHPVRFLSGAFSPLAAVHVANAFLHADSLDRAQGMVEAEYLRASGLEKKLPEWWAQRPAQSPPSRN
jgi:HD-like signal output (HDOD) protein/ActR/RegA family two-component response regulator